ncbi:MAG: hypothetical protein NC085_05760, partial [Muribaculaceae bacterium]|nr:hypothetical protein [Muribaculaceae bacterium]
MKKCLCALFAAMLCLAGCRNGNAAEQTAVESRQTASAAVEQTEEVTETAEETTAETTTAVTEEAAEDIAVSREYEFDLEKYLELPDSEKYLLREELDFLD